MTAKGWLQGRVVDSNASSVHGIWVYLKETPLLTDDTDSSGNYSIAYIPAGTYEARISATATYKEASEEVTVASGETVTWSPILEFQPGVPTIPTTTLFTP